MSTIYTFNNKVLKNSANDKWLIKKVEVDPLNPLGLPANTIRVKFSSGYTPSMGDTQTLVDSTNNVWDIYKSSDNWQRLFKRNNDLLEVLGANTSEVARMNDMFNQCTSLTSIPLFDTYSVTNMMGMFNGCTSLTSIPLFNTSSVINMNIMFDGCTNVQSGALALYQQASSQATLPSSYDNTFRNCGSNTQTGSAELAQIPSSWGGTGA